MSLTVPSARPSRAAAAPPGRRYDLDAVRVGAFGLLILYHVGMFYVTWDWHVKSPYASAAAEPLMRLVNPWRLAILFFVSGVAVRFATDKASSRGRFAASRLLRLGLPILVGMLVTVAPQTYFELRQDGAIPPDFGAFYARYLSGDLPLLTPTWNHLWYLVYLLVYVLLLLPVLPLLRRLAAREALGRLLGGPWRLLLLVPLPFILFELTLSERFPTTHALVDDWGNHAHRLTIFLLGVLAAKDERFWGSVDRALPAAAAIAILLVPARLFAQPLYDALTSHDLGDGAWTVGYVLYAWSVIVALLGFARRAVRGPSAALAYANGAVFCWYVLHQTIIVAVGYALAPMRLGAWPEAILVILATVIGCLAGYELLRRVPGVRIAFGIKEGRRRSSSQAAPQGSGRTAPTPR
ncbi:acyltransferase family protein [Parvularcula dongshanensis]|uniref:Acyltransferase 3 domain-containing protein n=1 Tax=Parvularcula dongshanensis TaxID=1173995 RepID=A0A840I4L8_9PROT|nr:acyltransferase [Parvularcula dongshanensis]MBB4658970.1 hypothetical protein [Parvularcula dongshanensis]